MSNTTFGFHFAGNGPSTANQCYFPQQQDKLPQGTAFPPLHLSARTEASSALHTTSNKKTEVSDHLLQSNVKRSREVMEAETLRALQQGDICPDDVDPEEEQLDAWRQGTPKLRAHEHHQHQHQHQYQRQRQQHTQRPPSSPPPQTHGNSSSSRGGSNSNPSVSGATLGHYEPHHHKTNSLLASIDDASTMKDLNILVVRPRLQNSSFGSTAPPSNPNAPPPSPAGGTFGGGQHQQQEDAAAVGAGEDEEEGDYWQRYNGTGVEVSQHQSTDLDGDDDDGVLSCVAFAGDSSAEEDELPSTFSSGVPPRGITGRKRDRLMAENNEEFPPEALASNPMLALDEHKTNTTHTSSQFQVSSNSRIRNYGLRVPASSTGFQGFQGCVASSNKNDFARKQNESDDAPSPPAVRGPQPKTMLVKPTDHCNTLLEITLVIAQSGRRVSLGKFSRMDSLATLRDRVEDKTGVPHTQQRLTVCGRELPNETTHNIETGSPTTGAPPPSHRRRLEGPIDNNNSHHHQRGFGHGEVKQQQDHHNGFHHRQIEEEYFRISLDGRWSEAGSHSSPVSTPSQYHTHTGGPFAPATIEGGREVQAPTLEDCLDRNIRTRATGSLSRVPSGEFTSGSGTTPPAGDFGGWTAATVLSPSRSAGGWRGEATAGGGHVMSSTPVVPNRCMYTVLLFTQNARLL